MSAVIVGDIIVLGIAFWVAFLLRYDFLVPAGVVDDALVQTPFFVGWLIAVAWTTGIYRIVGRYVGFGDVIRFVIATGVALAPLGIIRAVAPWGVWRIPLSVSLMATAGGYAALLTVRVLERAGHEHRRRLHHSGGAPGSVRTILVGAGDAGVQAVREAQRRGDTGLHIIGFVDDDPLKQGARLSGIEVLGRIDALPELAAKFKVKQAIITVVDPDRELRDRVVALCDRASIGVRQVPGFFEILKGSVNITRFHDVAVTDLLERDPVQLDSGEMGSFITGRNVMVTGAGGSIGSELARQIAALRPHTLLLVERAEGALFGVERELAHRHPRTHIESRVADVTDGDRMRKLFEESRPDVVLHAAAHKHVAMMEANPGEAIKNNIGGTLVVAELAGEFKSEAFVLVSTDKAVRPRSVMGATKRAAEQVVQAMTSVFLDTRYISVRFGNVMGSSGSVLPIFQEQIRNGGPVTVTDADATRYFMTIPEASQLVLQAGAIARSGEIMVLDMGEPMRILDLAERLIDLSGFRPHTDIEIKIIGLKPGEKLHEELEAPGEELVATHHPKIFASAETPANGEGTSEVWSMLAMAEEAEGDKLRAYLSELVPEADLQ